MNMKCTELDYLFDAIKTLDEKMNSIIFSRFMHHR